MIRRRRMDTSKSSIFTEGENTERIRFGSDIFRGRRAVTVNPERGPLTLTSSLFTPKHHRGTSPCVFGPSPSLPGDSHTRGFSPIRVRWHGIGQHDGPSIHPTFAILIIVESVQTSLAEGAAPSFGSYTYLNVRVKHHQTQASPQAYHSAF